MNKSCPFLEIVNYRLIVEQRMTSPIYNVDQNNTAILFFNVLARIQMKDPLLNNSYNIIGLINDFLNSI